MTRIQSAIVHIGLSLWAFAVTILLVIDPLPTLVTLLSASSFLFVVYLASLAGFKPFAPKRRVVLDEITPSYEGETTMCFTPDFGAIRPRRLSSLRRRPQAVVATITPTFGA